MNAPGYRSGLKTYHLLGASLEGWRLDPKDLLAWSVNRVVDGFVDQSAYLAVVQQAGRHETPANRLESRIATLIDVDINPVSDLLQTPSTVAAVEMRWNAFNRLAPLGVETIVSRTPDVSLRRQSRMMEIRSDLREQVTTTCVMQLLSSPRRSAARPERAMRLQEQIRKLHITRGSLEDSIGHLYTEPAGTLEHCARALGCARRTLQREFTMAGLNFNILRQAVRLTIAGHLLRTENQSLTEVAQLAGFFDSAHFAHAWKRSSGITPSQYQALARHRSAAACSTSLTR
jgi:AraC-like DNA-binding protein